MSEHIPILKSRHGEVGRQGDEFYTMGAGHNLCVCMALEIEELRSERKEIAALCRRHNHPGVNVGAHALANEVLAIIESGEA